ncbi:MAG: prepilin-type N-terminal cleavage/methylation domain-containing protein, partial [Thermotogota bacterium]|nr:prepilin-type N-terminal cleavage/methylation domain-containing protein [Thermotogota bacterium]
MRRRSGFTLIEMMIVLAIIAALAATLTPIGMNALRQARATRTMADVRSIRLGLQSFYMTKNYLPNGDSVTPGSGGLGELENDLNPGYLEWNSLNDASKITGYATGSTS